MAYECCCGRTFVQTNAFGNHQRSCKKAKTRLSSALESAKENWTRLKKAKLNPPSSASSSTEQALESRLVIPDQPEADTTGELSARHSLHPVTTLGVITDTSEQSSGPPSASILPLAPLVVLLDNEVRRDTA